MALDEKACGLVVMKKATPTLNQAAVLKKPQSAYLFPERWITQVVVLFFLISSNFIPSEEISLGLLFLVAGFPFAFGLRIPRGIWFATWPLVFMITLGFLGSFGKDAYDIFKDFWYFGKAILTIIFGYLVMWRLKKLEIVLRLFVFSAVIVSGIHLIRAGLDLSILNEPIEDIRRKLGTGYMISILGIAIIIASWKYRINLFFSNMKLFSIFAFVICFLSVALSFSRTLWMSLVLVAILSLSTSKARRVRTFALISLLVVVFTFGALGLASTLQDSQVIGPFMEKITRSIDELVVSDYVGMSEINAHWRGFETYQALLSYKSGNFLQYFFGQGFGTFVDLGFFMSEENIKMRFVPIVHNGYLYILIKTGLIGLALYFYFFAMIFKMGLSSGRSDTKLKFPSFLLMALVLIFFTTTYVITGIFNKNALFAATLLLGCLLCYFINIRGDGFKKVKLIL
jgi:hypothetical protein